MPKVAPVRGADEQESVSYIVEGDSGGDVNVTKVEVEQVHEQEGRVLVTSKSNDVTEFASDNDDENGLDVIYVKEPKEMDHEIIALGERAASKRQADHRASTTIHKFPSKKGKILSVVNICGNSAGGQHQHTRRSCVVSQSDETYRNNPSTATNTKSIGQQHIDKDEKDITSIPDGSHPNSIAKVSLPEIDEGTDEVSTSCRKCTEKYRQVSDTKHVGVVHGHRGRPHAFSCLLCGHQARTKCIMQRHIDTQHLRRKQFRCNHCDYASFLKNFIKAHLSKEHSLMPSKKDDEEQSHWRVSFVDETEIDCVGTDASMNTLPLDAAECTECVEKASELRDVKYAIVAHGEKHAFSCTLCAFQASGKSDIVTHIDAKHQKGDRFQCNHCDFATFYRLSIRKHLKSAHCKIGAGHFRVVHSTEDDSNYPKDKSSFHVVATADSRCGKCVIKSKQVAHMKQIRIAHEMLHAFACTLCAFHTEIKADILMHMRTCHRVFVQFQCNHCQETFFTKARVDKHLKYSHQHIGENGDWANHYSQELIGGYGRQGHELMNAPDLSMESERNSKFGSAISGTTEYCNANQNKQTKKDNIFETRAIPSRAGRTNAMQKSSSENDLMSETKPCRICKSREEEVKVFNNRHKSAAHLFEESLPSTRRNDALEKAKLTESVPEVYHHSIDISYTPIFKEETGVSDSIPCKNYSIERGGGPLHDPNTKTSIPLTSRQHQMQMHSESSQDEGNSKEKRLTNLLGIQASEITSRLKLAMQLGTLSTKPHVARNDNEMSMNNLENAKCTESVPEGGGHHEGDITEETEQSYLTPRMEHHHSIDISYTPIFKEETGLSESTPCRNSSIECGSDPSHNPIMTNSMTLTSGQRQHESSGHSESSHDNEHPEDKGLKMHLACQAPEIYYRLEHVHQLDTHPTKHLVAGTDHGMIDPTPDQDKDMESSLGHFQEHEMESGMGHGQDLAIETSSTLATTEKMLEVDHQGLNQDSKIEHSIAAFLEHDIEAAADNIMFEKEFGLPIQDIGMDNTRQNLEADEFEYI